MATATYMCPIEDWAGAITSKDHSIVAQTKKHRVGKYVIMGKHELRKRNMRDYKRAPLTPAEKVQVDKFAEACAYIRTWWNSDINVMKQSPHYQYWYDRWIRQASKPDKTILDEKGRTKVYVDFRAYVRAMYMRGERMPDADVLN